MLFIIEEDIVNSSDTNFLKCFENLLLGYIEGFHLLFIKPKVVDLITEKYYAGMDDRMKKHFYHYQEKFMLESKIAYNLVNYAIKIVPTTIDEAIIDISTHNIGYLHANKFLNSATIQKTILLGENSDDGDIYEIFAKEYLKEEKSTLRIMAKIENGGGSTTTPTFKRKIDPSEELCLCILDSDRKFPSDLNMGETAKRIIREVGTNITPKVHYYIEDRCRELENMIPEGFYHIQYKDDINKIKIFDDFLELNLINDKLILFFDLKKGLKHFDVRKLDDWSELPKLSMKYNTVTTCNEHHFCNKKDDCRYIMIKGFGTNVLEHFINFYKVNSDKMKLILNSANQYLENIWYDIGKLVFSWTCGQDKSIANT